MPNLTRWSVLLLCLFWIIKLEAQLSTDDYITKAKQYYHNNTDTAMFYAQKALEQARVEMDSLDIGRAYQTIGIVYQYKGDYKTAVSIFYETKQLFESLNSLEQVSYTNSNLARCYQYLGLYDKAAESFLASLRFFESRQDSMVVSRICLNIGIVYELIKDYETALNYYEQALQYNVENNLIVECAYYGNKANVLRKLNRDKSEVLSCYFKAVALLDTTTIKDYLSKIYLNIADVYAKSNDFDSALYYLDKGYAASEEYAKNNTLYYVSLGEVHFETKNYDQALAAINQAHQLAEQSGDQQSLSLVLFWLRKIYAQLGDYRNAFDYSIEEKTVSDSLYEKERIKQVQALEIQYSVEKKEQQILMLNDSLALAQNKKALAEERARVQGLYKNIAMGGILVVLLFVGLLYNRMRLRNRLFSARETVLKHQHKVSELERTQLQQELEHKNRSLSNLALAAVQKNEMLDQLEGQLQQLTQDNTQVSTTLRPIQQLIRAQASIEEDWNQFKVHFEEVHPDFYKRLLEVAPSLTQNDLKHCTYIKVKLESKAIARIMGISPKSVQMSRYRIKKKLQLDKEEDLFGFIERL